MDVKQLIPPLRRGSAAFEALVVVTTAATTAVITYKIASKRIEAVYAQKLEDELEATRKFYSAFHEKPSPAELVEELGLHREPEVPAELIQQYAGTDPRPDLELSGKGALTQYNRIEPKPTRNDDGPAIQLNMVVQPPTQNIFEGGFSTDTVPQELVDSRTEHAPYIISQEEFTESECPQDTMTYWVEDGVLSDTQDEAVDDVENLIGEENLQSFGIGSGDQHVLYVHNPRTGMDFEIVMNQGSYARTVHGLTKDE